MLKIIQLIVGLLLCCDVFAQTVHYDVNLTKIVSDQVFVECTVTGNTQNTVRYSFPKVVPGTYAVEDYGKYIASFKASTSDGQELPVNKIGNNTFEIKNAAKLARIVYLVNDAMDTTVKENKIFEPASTNIDDHNIVMNNGGFFGFIEGTEDLPITLNFTKPDNYFGATSLPVESFSKNMQSFRAKSYHHLVDCPILWCEPDTAQFMVNNTKVTIACYDVLGKKRAHQIYELCQRDMEGVARFLPKLPVDNYTFLLYIDNFEKYTPYLSGEKIPNVSMIKEITRKFKGLGIGALEHGNSSLYYLADFGPNMRISMLNLGEQFTSAAIHEFMHIITPLSLHSQHIGNFNYVNPVMSKHLWLYEGCTEYFANLIKLQAGIYTPEKFLSEMLGKQVAARRFPFSKMSITEMSANVLQKREHKQYTHVYDRGAVNAMLLDAQIITLTDGKKTLKDVILELVNRYGADKSFNEDTFIDELVALVHPDLKQYFTNCVEGRMDYDMTGILSKIGIDYYDGKTEFSAPASPFIDFVDAKKRSGKRVQESEISKHFINGQEGDMPSKEFSYRKLFVKDGRLVPEGTVVDVPIVRDGKEIKVPYKVVYQPIKKESLLLTAKPTAEQQRFWKVYAGIKE